MDLGSIIKSEICRELKKQMIYTNGNLKYKSKKISYRRSGIFLKIFTVVFDVPEGMKKVLLEVSEVVTKALRYSSLHCHDMKVTLTGEAMTASTSYSLYKAPIVHSEYS